MIAITWYLCNLQWIQKHTINRIIFLKTPNSKMILMRCDTQINHDIFVILLRLIKRFCQKWMLTLITKGNEYTELVSNVLFDNVGNIIVCILLEIQFSTMIIFYFCEQNTKLFFNKCLWETSDMCACAMYWVFYFIYKERKFNSLNSDYQGEHTFHSLIILYF